MVAVDSEETYHAGVDCHIGWVCTTEPSSSEASKCAASNDCDIHENWVYGEGIAMQQASKKKPACVAAKDWHASTCLGKSRQPLLGQSLAIEIASVALAIVVVNMIWC